MKPNTIYHGDCLEVMRQWPAECIDVVVTSPPYWRIRDYGVDGQLGLEKSPEEYIEKMVAIFREVRRVLRPWGTAWVNMGDTHASGKGSCRNPGGGERSFAKKRKAAGAHPLHRGNVSDLRRVGLKPQELCGIPGRLVLALQADGWWRKSDIIWNKLGHMPESVNGWRWERHRIKIEKGKTRTQKYGKARLGMQDHSGTTYFGSAKYKDCPGCSKCEKTDKLVLRKGAGRPTVCYDHIFLLAKSKTYFYDTDAVRTKTGREASLEEYEKADGRSMPSGNLQQGVGAGFGAKKDSFTHPSGANLRNVWTMATGCYPEAHYATFPEELPRRCILAGTSARGNCSKCGQPWVRIVKTKRIKRSEITGWRDSKRYTGCDSRNDAEDSARYETTSTTLGWRPSCSHDAEVVPPIVLDPFFGSGTTGMVATDLGRNWIGIEISEEYITKQAKLRTAMRGFHELTA